MLYLIGLGLWDESDISLRAIDALKKCDEVYLETYTNKWLGSVRHLEEIIGKEVKHLKRIHVESDMLIDIAKETDVALLIPGDPLVATTHIQLMIDAKAKGAAFDVIHSSSIYTAVAETGLQLYKFGRATTLAFIEKSFKPSSPYEMIMENRKMGLHTLVLLDVKEDNRYMTIADGIYVLNQLGMDDIKIVACCQLGSESQKIRYGNMKELSEDASLAETPAAIIIPGRLHFKEEEALRMYEK
ncbi:MAG: diphthine synthase [archaeon GW2011_AR5]|nr:MAG: diphthine synthase [archaeon GW2011_AR5]